MTPLAAEEELQVPGCYPYGVRARGSERSRHMYLDLDLEAIKGRY